MRRVLFNWAGTPVYSYSAMLYVGIVLGIYAELYAAMRTDLDIASTWMVTLLLLMTALLGARLLHVLAHWRMYRERPSEILQCSKGGASMYGGLLIAVPISIPVLATFELPFGAFWDVATFTMLVGMIVTRVGCLLNGCCAGRPTSKRWGVMLPDHRGVWRRRIPAPMLEIVWGAIVLAGAVWLWGRLSTDGALLLYVVGAYGAGRIVLEAMRDEQDRIIGLRLHTGLSAAFVLIALAAAGLACLQ